MLLNNNENILVLVGLLTVNTAQAFDFQSPIVFDDDEQTIITKPVSKPATTPTKVEPKKPPNIQPYQIPTFTGAPVDYNIIQPAINPLPKINGDAIFQIINKCYPLKSGFGLEISARTGLTYKPTNTNSSTTVNTLDSQTYYAGIVANMPLYSDIEIDKDRKVEYQRRMQTTATIKEMLTAVATKRRAERLMGLYLSLEKRAQMRIKEGIAPTEEQITYLEKVATTQGELDAAVAAIEGTRLALIGQCRPEAVNQVNNYILEEIGEQPANDYEAQ